MVDGVSVSGGDGGQHTVTKSQLAERQLCVCVQLSLSPPLFIYSHFPLNTFFCFTFVPAAAVAAVAAL